MNTNVTNKQNVLEVKSLCVDYEAANGTVHAVADVNLTLARGEVIGLAGESGCGKSTLAYAIARLHRPPARITGGQILYYPDQQKLAARQSKKVRQLTLDDLDDAGAVDILDFTPQRLRAFRWSELAIVFQSAMNALNPVLNVEKQIFDVLKTHRPEMTKDELRERAREMMRLVGIAPDRLRSFPHELSGGMRQRAIIAIALALSPEIIIMDEPTTALDVVVQRDILSELLMLKEQFGFSVIFITHDLSLLLEIADKVAVMYAGHIIEQATRADILAHPRHPYTYGLLNSFPSLHGERRRMSGIPGSPPDLRALPAGCSFNPRCRFRFDACTHVVPQLLIPNTDSPQQRAACHLYDPALNPAAAPSNLAQVSPNVKVDGNIRKPNTTLFSSTTVPATLLEKGERL